MRPFQQIPFSELPQVPRKAHRFLELPLEHIYLPDVQGQERGYALRKVGSGPPLLLLHGLMTSSYSWRYVYAPLAEHFTVYMVDLPGHGESTMAPHDFDLHHCARWLHGLQRSLELENLQAVGNSLGGAILLRYALDHPGALRRLSVIHPPLLPTKRLRALEALLKLPLTSQLATLLPKLSGAEKWAHKNVHYYDESLKSREEAEIYGGPLRTSAGRAAFAAWLKQGMRAEDFAELSKDLEERCQLLPPLQSIYAESDPMVPPRVGHWLERTLKDKLPDTDFHWLSESSHFAHVDTPEAVLRRLIPFLTSDALPCGEHIANT